MCDVYLLRYQKLKTYSVIALAPCIDAGIDEVLRGYVKDING
jgi:hypothetical protein